MSHSIDDIRSFTVTQQQAAYIHVAVSLAGIAGVIPKQDAYELVERMHAIEIAMIRGVLNGEVIAEE